MQAYANMHGYMRLPEPIWSNIILPYLGLHDAMALRLINSSSHRAFYHFIEKYCTFIRFCIETIANETTFNNAKVSFQRQIARAYTFLAQNLQIDDFYELQCSKPTDAVCDLMTVWITLLTGRKHQYPIRDFLHCTDYVTPLRDISSSAENSAMLRSFKSAYSSEHFEGESSVCEVFWK
jgi:hypothetical protein